MSTDIIKILRARAASGEAQHGKAWAQGVLFAANQIEQSSNMPANGRVIEFFSLDPDEHTFMTHGTLEEAHASAEEILSTYRDDAPDSGWPENGPNICYGAILGGTYESSRKVGEGRGDWEGMDVLDFSINNPLATPTLEFQSAVESWMQQCFMPSLYSNLTERGDRFLEEALELLQSIGYDRTRVATLVDYVYSRPVGEPAQEVGGTMVTLAGLCWVAGLDMHGAADVELQRITRPEVMEKIRLKQEAKNALHFDTPIPGSDPISTTTRSVCNSCDGTGDFLGVLGCGACDGTGVQNGEDLS